MMATYTITPLRIFGNDLIATEGTGSVTLSFAPVDTSRTQSQQSISIQSD